MGALSLPGEEAGEGAGVALDGGGGAFGAGEVGGVGVDDGGGEDEGFHGAGLLWAGFLLL